MKMKLTLIVCALVVTAGGAACRRKQTAANNNGNAAPNANQQAQTKEPHALPDNAFKAQITLPSPPAKLRAGQQERVQVHVKNASDVFWWARGGEQNERSDNKFYIAAGDRWLKPDGTPVADDGRYGIGKDLKPGDETEVPLLVTAPKEPGEYILEVDLLQEQVAWFADKGSPTARAKVTVVR
jgi:glucose/arabinose dehydrogenase